MHHHCLTQIQQNLGDANRKSGKVASQFGKLFCDNLLPAEFFFFFWGGGGEWGDGAGTSPLFHSGMADKL